MALSVVNPNADVLRQFAALAANTNAAKGLQEVVRTNLGPRGTLKMLVGGAGQIKITKDGNVLLHEMQIQHPTASMIARASTAQDDMTGDGTTSNVLLIGELMKQCERFVSEGIHPRVLCEGIDLARAEVLKLMDSEIFKIPMMKDTKLKNTEEGGNADVEMEGGGQAAALLLHGGIDRELLTSVARTSLRTKVHPSLADMLTDVVVEASLTIKREGQDYSDIDLFMVEILHMRHRLSTETRLVKGMVMDHGTRHPDMPKKLKNCYILTCNVSLEYEKSEVNSGFFYSSVDQREKLVDAERKFTDEKVRKIIELKKKVCTPENGKNFVVLNQKGIDPPSLDMFSKENIMALRRVKRRNMERLACCCGGVAVNCVEDLQPEDLGFAEEVYEQMLGEDKFTFVEGVKNPTSCCILLKGPNDHTITQMKDAIRDGLRAVKNVFMDGCVVPGAGAFEVAAYSKLQEFAKSVSGKKTFGVRAFADAMLVVPKALASNSGLDVEECILRLIEEYEKTNLPVGMELMTGQPISPIAEGIWDNYRVKRQLLALAPTLAQQLLLVDEVIKAGKSMGGGGGAGEGGP